MTASARLTDLRTADGSADDPSAAAGVLLRQTTDLAAPYYFVGLTAANGLVVQDRTITGTAATLLVQTAGITTPLYLRADRIGAYFTAYTSTDSITWVPLAGSSVTLSSMSGDIEQGVAVTSHQASVTTAATFDYVRMDACPDTWSCSDLSGALPQGSQYLSNGVWSLRGTQQSRYVWQSITGDSGLSARLTALDATRPTASANLLYAYEGTGAVPYYLAGMTPNYGLVVQARTTTGGAISYPASMSSATLPLYVDVVRAGNTFTTYTSPDDTIWTAVPGSSVTIGAMGDTAYLGLDVNSADPNAWTTATFDTVDITGTTETEPPVGTDLTNLDTHTEQYTQAANGLVDLHLYNNPIGIPVPSQWQRRDTTLITSTSVITPANLPFTETLAADTTGLAPGSGVDPTMALLTSEDGITLGVALATTVPYATGAVQSNAVMYAAAMPSQRTPAPPASDLALRSTASGLDARVVLHSASEAGPFVLNLTGDASMQLAQDTSGAIQVTEPVTVYDANGVASGTVTRTEYIAQSPILVDSSAAVTTPVSTGPATATLSGSNTVTLNVDPSWLNDPNRHFPATLDLPLTTTYSSNHTGLWGTVNSCAPNLPAPRTEVVAGTLNACTYHGQAYFDTTTLTLDTPVMSATLYLYTPNQMTSTGVQVYSNTASDAFDPTTLPSWNSAPSAATTGVAQSGSDGHWQSWDVTSIVQGWVNDNTSNAGLTLAGSGAPVTFASPLGAASGGPAVAPYLDITYDPHPAARGGGGSPYGPYLDGAESIYGLSGSFSVNNPKCPPTRTSCTGLTPPYWVSHNLGGAFIRVGVNVPCSPINPGSNYWDAGGFTNSPGMNGGQGSIVEVMINAFNNGLIPIVTFLLPNNATCHNAFSPTGSSYQSNWTTMTQNFVNSLPASWRQLGFPLHTYFEIGNETNFEDPAYYGNNPAYYPDVFAAAASGLYHALGSQNAYYTILTCGMLNPAVNDHVVDPAPNAHGLDNHVIAAKALAQAVAAVPSSLLGFAVHPYHYDTFAPNITSTTSYWQNFYLEYGEDAYHTIVHNGYASNNDLGDMINLWTHKSKYYKHKAVVVFTEENWSDHPDMPIDTGNARFCSDGTGCEGAYLADLFTWLFKHNYAVAGAAATSYSPIRVAWYRGTDSDRNLGLNCSWGATKPFLVRRCGSLHSSYDTDLTFVAPNGANTDTTMLRSYSQLRTAACY